MGITIPSSKTLSLNCPTWLCFQSPRPHCAALLRDANLANGSKLAIRSNQLYQVGCPDGREQIVHVLLGCTRSRSENATYKRLQASVLDNFKLIFLSARLTQRQLRATVCANCVPANTLPMGANHLPARSIVCYRHLPTRRIRYGTNVGTYYLEIFVHLIPETH